MNADDYRNAVIAAVLAAAPAPGPGWERAVDVDELAYAFRTRTGSTLTVRFVVDVEDPSRPDAATFTEPIVTAEHLVVEGTAVVSRATLESVPEDPDRVEDLVAEPAEAAALEYADALEGVRAVAEAHRRVVVLASGTWHVRGGSAA